MNTDFKSIVLTAEVYEYMRSMAEPPHEAQSKLMTRTKALGDSAEMQIPHEQAVLLTLLVQMTGAASIVDVGTYTGYSALALALGTTRGGRVITCDDKTDWISIAQDAWRDAQVDERIDFRLGDARSTLTAISADEPIDLVFIDADKVSYIDYWEILVPKVRPGGVLLADNVLYYGQAAADDVIGNAKAIKEFNDHVRADDRVESVMLPISDGLTIARRRR